MGRTLPSFMQVIQQEQAEWSKFRRALRQEDQRILDDLFTSARYHVAACAYASQPTPLEAMLMAMLIEDHKAIRRLEDRIAQLEDVCLYTTGGSSTPIPASAE
ncbi:MAG: hypothetical protein KDI03_09315 [Anaerolineae bacterium]|nr:hypothetical protein [Anaerolineae bacterium]MCB0200255.1 hypothetical protein [Anaerolineae bacterium]MCB0207274.1 hypothetical protein [Anaerolineae bacterium]MCB0253111.1 hypothetical protein [Anaerolineae bacterium]